MEVEVGVKEVDHVIDHVIEDHEVKTFVIEMNLPLYVGIRTGTQGTRIVPQGTEIDLPRNLTPTLLEKSNLTALDSHPALGVGIATQET